uniref:F-box/kelch-repeat protein At3g06240-like n=1 Tax=Erigeron canadensis TaxID=72917 RepID=UPI001CB92022|nr:F-box/kelch-repeat protein At3g06240-like [Erigeron canadensis]
MTAGGRAMRQRMMSMEKLSDDELSNIFIRLPARQLVQMRCVSKPWNVFLSTESSYLTKSHLNHSLRNKHNEIVLAFTVRNKGGPEVWPYNLSGTPFTNLSDLVKVPADKIPLMRLSSKGGHVIGSVNGLLCFYIGPPDFVKGIYIWNPSLSLIMPLYVLCDPKWAHSYNYRFYFGFGFDPKTDDYKVVKLVRDHGKLMWLPVEVYSMKKRSWEFIVDSFPSDVDKGFDMCVDDHDGHLHWLCKMVDNNDIQTIVAFDLGVESPSFRQISLPDSVASNCDTDNLQHTKLCMLHGKLCVVSYTIYDHGEGKLQVWVMNEYGVAESWVKSHVLSNLKGEHTIPIGFTLNSKFLFHDNIKGVLASYDQETATVTHLGSYRLLHCLGEVVQYVDSLVWYAGPSHEEWVKVAQQYYFETMGLKF